MAGCVIAVVAAACTTAGGWRDTMLRAESRQWLIFGCGGGGGGGWDDEGGDGGGERVYWQLGAPVAVAVEDI